LPSEPTTSDVGTFVAVRPPLNSSIALVAHVAGARTPSMASVVEITSTLRRRRSDRID